MRLVLVQGIEGAVFPGLLTDQGIIDISKVVESSYTPQLTMESIINSFKELKPLIERLAETSDAIPIDDVRLLPPLPRPGKILGCIGNYWEHQQREPRELNMFLKSPDAVIGPGNTITLPEFTEPWIFMHEAELAIVIKGPAYKVSQEDWRTAVFGYTCLIDVSAREKGRRTWKARSWLGKSFDTFAPLGPCITTIEDVPDPNDLHVKFWNNGQLRHNYNTDDMEHRVPELIEFVTTFMTLNTGDVIACGTNHEGLGALQDGEIVEIEIEKIGRMALNVSDPLKRVWERGVYMGADSTNPKAVKRNRPRDN